MKRKLFILSMVLVLSLVMAACSSNKTNVRANSANTAAESQTKATAEESKDTAATKVVQSQFGEVIIPVAPEKLLVLNSSYAEYLIELGVVPQMVTIIEEVEPQYRAPYFKEHGVEMIPTVQYQFNLEQILELSPDLIIINGSAIEQSVYDELSKIAPTVALDASVEMKDALPKLAAIFDKNEQANEILAEFDEKAKIAREKIATAIGDKTVLVLRVESNQYRYMGPKAGNSSIFFYQTLGLNAPEAIKETDTWFLPFSMEILPELNPDYIFLEDRVLKGYDTTESMNSLTKSKIWTSLDAVKNNHVFPLKTNDFTGGLGPVGSILLVDYVVEQLVQE
ncbi:ABC transporter substrate-binding protein [Paenibacillus camerounensis]|uniref:ABC transporter substrate-binding protein n=1 Tax=Paenibacillus camerounensis TaxID=1243663 RepID=UPI0005A616FD|nr:ABC transporter substrate-binding protein [Paenibacillus camerounensis]